MAPEVLRASGGADAPAVVALRASLENLNSWKGEGNGLCSTHREAIECKPIPLITLFVCPEVPRTSGGADAPAVVAIRAPLHHFVVPDLALGPNKGMEEDREDPVLINPGILILYSTNSPNLK